MQTVSHQIFSRIVADNLDAGIMLIDSALLVVAANGWISERSGLRNGEISGRKIADVFNLDLPPQRYPSRALCH